MRESSRSHHESLRYRHAASDGCPQQRRLEGGVARLQEEPLAPLRLLAAAATAVAVPAAVSSAIAKPGVAAAAASPPCARTGRLPQQEEGDLGVVA